MAPNSNQPEHLDSDGGTSYRQMVESASDVFARVDPQGRFLYGNAALLKVTGQQPAYFVGKTYWEAGLPPALCEQWDRNIARIVREGAEFSVSFDFPTPAGLRHLDFHLIPERNGAGAVVSVLAIGRDVTELKRMQETLVRSAARLREAQHIAQLGSWEWEPATGRHVWSDECFTLLRCSPELEGPSMETFLRQVHPDDRASFAARLARLDGLSATPRFQHDFRLLWPDGAVRHIQSRGEALFDEAGRLVKLVGTFQDVTGWHLAEQALRQSEARYRLLAENATDMVASFSPDLRFTYTSPSTERITGHAPGSLIDRPIMAFVHPADHERVGAALSDVLATTETAQVVYRYRHADGHYIWFETTGRAIRDPETGTLLGYQATSRDVSGRMADQAALQALSHQQDLILSSVGEGIYGLASDGTVSFINQAGARMLGYEADELVGRDSGNVPSLPWACPDGGSGRLPGSGTHEEIVWRRDGSCFPAEYTVTPVAEPVAGLGTVVTFRDVTARKRQETELRVANHELMRLSVLKDEFLSTISHELRTPLAAIRNAAAIVAKEKAGPLTAIQARFMGIIRDHVARLHRMVDDVLDMQRLEAGSMPHRPVIADLRPVVLEVVNGYSPVFAERGIQVAVALSSEALTASFDRDRLAQALINVLSNAAKFTPAGGRVTVYGVMDADTDSVRLSIEDTGVGIPAGDLARIFDKFVQADGGLTRQVGGTGLGLSICKTIIEGAHGGRLWVESAEGRGTTFHIALPARMPEEDWTEG
jgi:PAS domain S-box-containing protein